MIAASWMNRRVGDFEIEERIGRGGSASVYRAKQVPVNRYVALKIIDLDEQDHTAADRRFRQEAQVVASLEHLHILPIYDYGVVEDRYAYFVTRLMSRSLNDTLRDGALSLETAAKICMQIGAALSYAHAHGVIHRDIKPSNILLDDAGNAYLSDFGLARRFDLRGEIETGIVGTPSYIAPEILLGKPADHRSDIYSFGVVMYHMLTGRVPFEVSSGGLSVASLFYKHVQQPPPAPRSIKPSIPQSVEKVILRALAKNPQERYFSVSDLMIDFQAALDSRPFVPLRPLRLSLKPSSLIVVTVLSVLTLIIVASALSLRSDALSGRVNIERGARARLADLVPTDDELRRAQMALGDSGYIAYLSCGLQTVWQNERARELNVLAQQLGVRLRLFDANGDAYTQSTQIETARLAGAGAIILCPLNGEMALDLGELLVGRNIPLAYTTLVESDYGIKLDSGGDAQEEANRSSSDSARLLFYGIVKQLAGSPVPEILSY
jgi:serine/threonine protein kinase